MDKATAAYFNRYTPFQPTSGCWLWIGNIGGYGYGRWTRSDKNYGRPAHVVAWEMAGHKPAPLGMNLDHCCRVRRCVNPDHLEVVSPRTNTLRGIGPTAVNARKQICKRGHILDGENLRVKKNGWRNCRACHQQKRETYNANRKERRHRRREVEEVERGKG